MGYGILNKGCYADDIISMPSLCIFIKYGSDFSSYPYKVRLLNKSKYLSAFLLMNSTEKQAIYLFAQAMDSLKTGDFQQAFVLGLKSRELNYEPKGQLEYILSRDLP